MKNILTLPEGYAEYASIDLQSNKKTTLLVNAIAALIALVLIGVALPLVSIGYLFDMSEGFTAYFVRFGVLLAGSFVYMLLHELVHGIFMRAFSGIRPHYGFTGLYAYTGSDAYFDRLHYLIIGFAPVVIWGLVLTAINGLMPLHWFWVVYFIQVLNLSGAAGDFYVGFKLRKMPTDLLVYDTGVSMTVYSRTPKPDSDTKAKPTDAKKQ